MDSPRTRLIDKIAFFNQLEGLNEDKQDAHLWASEEKDRQDRLAFFRPAPLDDGMAALNSRPVVQETPSDVVRPQKQVIMVSPDSSVVQDSNDGQQRGSSSAEPPPKNEQPRPKRRVLPWLKEEEEKPQGSRRKAPPKKKENRPKATLPKATPKAKAKGKKNDKATLEMRPPEQQIFKTLVFYNLPQDNPSTLRRKRVEKETEFGAIFVDTPTMATHIVADSYLTYQDITSWFAKNGMGHVQLPPIVTEDYPPECMHFRRLLDHNQKKFQVAGQPAPGEVEQRKSGESVKIKASKIKDDSWARSTPDASDSEDAGSAELDSAVSPEGEAKTQKKRKHDDDSDELSNCISMMREEVSDSDDQPPSSQLQKASDDEERSGSEADERRARKRMRPGNKEIAFEDRFACNRASELQTNSDNPNARTIEVLQSMADYYTRTQDTWRTLSYRKAISTLARQKVRITTEADAIELPGIGQRLAQKIEEIVTTNKLRRLEYAQADDWADKILQLFIGIYGVGTVQAQQWISQGHRTLEDLMQKAKLTANQKVGIEHYQDLMTKIPRSEVEALGAMVSKAAAQIDGEVEVIIGGSYRRGAPESGDIDLVLTKPGTRSTAELRSFLDRLVQRLRADGFLTAQLASSRHADDGSKWHGCCVLPAASRRGRGEEAGGGRQGVWRRIDLLLVPDSERGAALLYFTGNDIFNRSMRLLASKRGMRLNQHGLYRDVLRGPGRQKLSEGQLVESRDEKRIFEVLGVRWREPHQRWC